MYIGNFGGSPCKIGINSPNHSVCVTGQSGTGKTSRLNRIELEAAKDGVTVLVLDVNRTHTEGQVFPPVCREYEENVNRINVMKEGLGDGLLTPMKTSKREETFVHHVNSAILALSSLQRFGSRQTGILREAVIYAIQNLEQFSNEAEALKFALNKEDDAVAEAVYQKLWTLLNGGALKKSEKEIEAGRINVLDFSEADIVARRTLAEIALSNIWRKVCFGEQQVQQDRLIVVLDEFQNLSLKADSTLRTMLREGRRFGVGMVLATQTFDVFPGDVCSILNQAATHLYFRPADNEIKKIVRDSSVRDKEKLKKQFENLRIGESIAVGDFDVDGQQIHRLILLK